MDTKKSVPLDKLLQAVSLGNVEDEVLSSIAARLARLDKDASDADRAKVVELKRRQNPARPGARHCGSPEPSTPPRHAARMRQTSAFETQPSPLPHPHCASSY
jgi:hypothetical protein